MKKPPMHRDVARKNPRGIALVAAFLISACAIARAEVPADAIKDLSLLVAPEMPCVWPTGMTPHAVIAARTIGPGPYHRDLILIDEHTGTQWDAPAHFVPPPDSGLPGAGPTGAITNEKVPAWQFCGEACVIDITEHVDDAAPGASYLIQPDIVETWEKKHRPLKPGDVVLFRSDYSDRYYQPYPAGDRFIALALRKEAPAWPAPTPETMQYLGKKGVMTIGMDGASMGPVPDLVVQTHQAGGRLGMIWTECATNLGSLPPTGAFCAILGPKHAGGSGGECRFIAITDRKLAARLIDSARKKQVSDLSVTLDEDYPVTWAGYAAGDEGSRYLAKTLNYFSTRGPSLVRSHMFDGQVGTHVVLPSFSLPAEGFDDRSYADDVQKLLARYEAKYGPRGASSLTVDRAPLGQMMGEAHVIDVRKLLDTTSEADWPASPAITVDLIKQHESAVRPIAAGEIVIFYSGYSDKFFKPLPVQPELDRLMAAPLEGKAEGWPAPTPEAIAYLADKGVRCLGTDGPTLGGANRQNALFVTWLAAGRGMLPIEFLTNVGSIADRKAFFLFAPVKIRASRGGYGRALALY